MKAMEDAAADQRPIVQSTAYNGPDRRVRKAAPPRGIERRRKDPEIITPAERRRILGDI